MKPITKKFTVFCAVLVSGLTIGSVAGTQADAQNLIPNLSFPKKGAFEKNSAETVTRQQTGEQNTLAVQSSEKRQKK